MEDELRIVIENFLKMREKKLRIGRIKEKKEEKMIVN